jgi:hypothetical protein
MNARIEAAFFAKMKILTRTDDGATTPTVKATVDKKNCVGFKRISAGSDVCD